MLTFIDDASRFVWVEFLKHKSQVPGKFKEFVRRYSSPTCCIKKIRSDNGGEYANSEMREFCKAMGIVQQFTEPYTPEQNGAA